MATKKVGSSYKKKKKGLPQLTQEQIAIRADESVLNNTCFISKQKFTEDETKVEALAPIVGSEKIIYIKEEYAKTMG